MIFGVFILQNKTLRVSQGEPDPVYKFTLVFKDEWGNQLTVSANEEDYDTIDVGRILPTDMILAQTTLRAKEAEG